MNLAEPKVFVGGLFGAALVFVFASFAIRAVGKSAGAMIDEVRRQFKADPGIMKGTSEPDYAACVDISVRSALHEMILPGALVVIVPILVGTILRWEAAAGMLMVGTIAGVLLAIVLNNGGGAWDNAKKYIEAGHLKDENGKVLGKGQRRTRRQSWATPSAIPSRTRQVPRCTSLIKLLATITLVLAPLFV